MSLQHDFSYAFRLARKHWLFSITVVVILALTTGANTAVLSVLNAALLEPLPYPEPERLGQVVVTMRSAEGDVTGRRESQTGRIWESVRDHAPSIDAAVYSGWTSGVNLTTGNKARYVQQQRVCSGFFRVLGVQPVYGREFNRNEDTPNGPAAVILSHRLFQQLFAGNPSAVGGSILLRGEPFTVVGVLPAGFRSNTNADLYTPLRPSTQGEGGGQNYGLMGRLRPGKSWQEANGQLAAIAKELGNTGLMIGRGDATLELIPLQEGLTQSMRLPLFVLWTAVAGVFLTGCVNIAGMVTARSSSRAAEIATRLALGAPLTAILRQLLTESALLAAWGAAAGVAAGYVALEGLKRVAEAPFPFLENVTLEPVVLAASVLLTVLVTLVFTVLPAWHSAQAGIRAAQSSQRTTASRKRFYSLGALTAAQVALTIPLLFGGGLLLRTFLHLWNLDPGFDPKGVLTARFSLQDARYEKPEAMNVYFERTLRRLRDTPGVEAAAVALSLPYERGLNMGFRLAGSEPGSRPNITNLNYVAGDYFQALRIPLLSGRLFTPTDGATSPKVALANQAFAKLYFPNEPALGQRLQFGDLGTVEIVGVVGDIQQRPGWGGYGPLAPIPGLYVPASQTAEGFLPMIHTWFSPSWIVRSTLPTGQLAAQVEAAAEASDPLLPIARFQTIADVKADSLTMQRLLASLVTVIAVLALLLSALGIYGLIANLTAQRTRELGIRIALGSSAPRAIRTALRPSIVWVASGLTGGTVAALALNRLIESFLYGVKPTDPLTLVAAGLLLLAVTLVAAIGPASRIARLNPSQTLRME